VTGKVQTIYLRHIRGLTAFDVMDDGQLIENKDLATKITQVNKDHKVEQTTPEGYKSVVSPELVTQNPLSKMTEFLAAHRNLLREGRVPDEVAHFRLSICTGVLVSGEKVSEPCPNYKITEDSAWGTGHCKACGCPDWPISEMHRPKKIMEPGKAWFPMGCPQLRFSGMPGRRAKQKQEKSDVPNPNFGKKEA
jgi:hypothetical protein